MYFEKKDDILICINCNKSFKYPIIFDCGTSFCMTCIELLTNADENGFNCLKCKQFHVKPTNEYFSKIKGIQPGKLVNYNKSSVSKIKIYCNELRNGVKQNSHGLIEIIKNQNVKLIEEIDQYERALTFKFNENNELCLNKFINENLNQENWTVISKNSKLEDAENKPLETKSNYYLDRFKKESKKFFDKLFKKNSAGFKKSQIQVDANVIESIESLNVKLIKKIGENENDFFKESNEFNSKNAESDKHLEQIYNETESLVHTIEQQNTSVIGRLMTDYSKQIESLTMFNFCKINKDIKKLGEMAVKFLNSDGKICIAYHQENRPYSIKNIGIYDRNLKKLIDKQINTFYDYYEIIRITTTENNSIFVSFSFDSIVPFGTWSSLVFKFDDQLNIMNKIKLNYETFSFTSFGNELFILAQKNYQFTKQVHVYDQDFNEIKKFGQREYYPNLFIENSTFMISYQYVLENFRITLDYYIFLCFDLKDFIILLIDKKDETIKKHYSIGHFYNGLYIDYVQDFFANSNTNVILTYNSESKKLFVYDLNEKLYYFYNLDLGRNFKLVDCHNGKLIFYNHYENCLCFKSA